MKDQHSASQPQIVALLASIAGLIAAVYFGRAIATGNVKTVYAVFVFAAGATLVLGMGKRYWLLAPLGFTMSLPLLPLGFRSFEVPEVAAIGVTGVYILMVALHRNVLHLGKPENIGIYLFFALLALIYAVYPVGLLAGGSDVVGGRFYFKVLLAILLYIVLTNQYVEDRDARWVIRFYLIGSLLSMSWGLVDYFVLGNRETGDEDGFYSWHQILAGPPFVFSVWMFARFKPSQVFSVSRPFLPMFYTAAVIISFASGKRAGVASILFVPLISCFIHKQFRYAYLAGGLLLAFFAMVITGQGSAFSLPLSAQRALMYLPAHWDPEIESMKAAGGMDSFREEMRRLAWEKALEHPWLGEGYRIDLGDTGGFGSQTIYQDPTSILAVGRAWHSFWLGLAADLGFISWPIYILIYLTAIWTALWVIRNTPEGSTRKVLSQMILTFIIINLLRSYTSGHSANNPFAEFWTFAILVAMKYSILQEKKKAREEVANSTPAPVTVPPARGNLGTARPQ